MYQRCLIRKLEGSNGRHSRYHKGCSGNVSAMPDPHAKSLEGEMGDRQISVVETKRRHISLSE
jgi:hypothetical protein